MIAFLLDIVYVVILVLASPWLVFKAMRIGKYRAGLAEKFFGTVPRRESDRPCVWFHAVSVGEVLLLRRVVAALTERRPDVEIVISTTTNTGMEVARQHFGDKADGTRRKSDPTATELASVVQRLLHYLKRKSNTANSTSAQAVKPLGQAQGRVQPELGSVPISIIYFPLDFSWAVSRAIRRIRPDVVALAELELWPNFIAAAKRFGARVAVINGRMSPRSRRGYGRVRFLMRHLLAKIDTFSVQTDEYARRFVEVGAPPQNVVVTGSVKYDGVETNRNNPTTVMLRQLLGIRPDEIVWVAGSTSEPEEEIVLDAYEKLRAKHPLLRLLVVPRHKERFDEVARLIESRGFSLVRRSRLTPHGSTVQPFNGSASSWQSAISNQRSAILLIDTLGELSAVWGLADIAFVGGSFAPRGGQNMIEPAGYGAAVTFGPGVWNFQDTVDHLLACGGAIQVATAEELCRTIGELATDEARRRRLGDAARAFVQSQHGATARTVEILNQLLPNVNRAYSKLNQAA